MLIGEFARKAGVSTDTIRFYEKLGFFSRNRKGNGYRIYSEQDLEMADLISSGKSIGYSLREILDFTKELSDGPVDHARAQASLQDKLEIIDARIASLRGTKKLIKQQIEHCRAVEAAEKLTAL
ncbi:MerR family transcriptional regulator [Streptomyces sp. NPDC002574]|uniref:MerR family transcriptional regulator n=1 Tax=Streptomyces sp. NPDC002574 TaxID=3364652 RepID=UPI0036CA8463